MLISEKIRKLAGIMIVLSVVTTIAVTYFNDVPLGTIWGATFILLLFESILFLVSFGIAKLIEKLSGQKPSQKPPVRIKANPRSGNVMVNDQQSRKCSKCGNEIEGGMIFCDKCGARVQ